MTAWLAAAVRGRVLEIAVALALGVALATLARAATDLGVDVLGQLVGRNPVAEEEISRLLHGRFLLNFELGSTVVVYGTILSEALALALVMVLCLAVVRRRERALGECPFCASLIPHSSTHCAYCGSSLTTKTD